MAINKTNSTRPVSGLPVSTQKRQTLVISESDPRAIDVKFLNENYGYVQILSDADFKKRLQQNPQSNIQNIDEGILVTTLHPPVNLYYDDLDPNSTRYVVSDGAIALELLMSFDPAIDDVTTDGAIEYVYDLQIDPSAGGATNSATGTSSTGTGTNTPTIQFPDIDPTTITYPTVTSSRLSIKWVALPTASKYFIGISGVNMLGSASNFNTFSDIASWDAAGEHTFTLLPKSGTSLSGTYSGTIYTSYSTGTSLGVPFSVTI
jgi:hypothetical protein